MSRVEWRKNIQSAAEEASGGTRLLMLFFYNEGCAGSEKMLDEALKDDRVVNLIEREYVPVMIEADKSKEVAAKYHIDWTPGFVVADLDGTELDKWVGYLPSEEFMAQATISKGLAAFHLGRLDEAKREFEMLIDEHPSSELVPEAEFFLGATVLRDTGDSHRLYEAYEDMKVSNPASSWTKRLSVWANVGVDPKKRSTLFDAGYAFGKYA